MCFKQCYKSIKIFHSFGAHSREGAVTKCRIIGYSYTEINSLLLLHERYIYLA